MPKITDAFRPSYDDCGSGPTVVLIHAFPLNRRMWQAQCEALVAAGYRVIAPDLRGFGSSRGSDNHFTLSTHADDIVSLMKYLGIGRSVFVGAASGNAVIHELLAKYPQRVAAACLLAPAVAKPTQETQRRFLKVEELARAGCHNSAIDELCALLTPKSATLAERALTNELHHWIESSGARAMVATLSAAIRPLNWNALQRKLPLPVMTLFGECDQIAPPPQNSEARQIIVGGDHLFNLKCSGEVNRRLLNFLEQLSSAKPGILRHIDVAA